MSQKTNKNIQTLLTFKYKILSVVKLLTVKEALLLNKYLMHTHTFFLNVFILLLSLCNFVCVIINY